MSNNTRKAFIRGRIQHGKKLNEDSEFAKNIATIINAAVAQVLISDYEFTEKEVQDVLFKVMGLAKETASNQLPKKPIKPTPARSKKKVLN